MLSGGGKVYRLLPRLSWLGLPDFRDIHGGPALNILERVLPKCTSLETLSIRSRHNGQAQPDFKDCHDCVCKLPYAIVQHAPQTVKTLELRLIYPYLNCLIDTLKARKSPIQRIGIDFGAWVQTRHYGKAIGKHLNEADVEDAAHLAARRLRFEIYEKNHNQTFNMETAWSLPQSPSVQDPYSSKRAETTKSDKDVSSKQMSCADGAKHKFEQDFFCNDESFRLLDLSSQIRPPRELAVNCPLNDNDLHHDQTTQYLDQGSAMTLNTMCTSLYDMVSRQKDFKMFALKPEWQNRSEEPLHPLALLQLESKQKFPDRTFAFSSSRISEQRVYQWLNETFNWRPVFDWDWFVKPDPANAEQNLYPAYNVLRNEWSLEALSTAGPHYDKLVVALANWFKVLKEARIPINILIGRRHRDGSSLYWGWPYDSKKWSQWLETPFDASLRTIAPLVDTLTVNYDLRNPLDDDRLVAIDELCGSGEEGFGRGNSFERCVRPVCPWAAMDVECPFCRQKTEAEMTGGQKMANGQDLRPLRRQEKPFRKTYTQKLASNLPGGPLVGEYAVDYHSGSSDTDAEHDDNATLHERARHAAFKREAVGWQRFWGEYAKEMANLTELRVRMPHCFDGIGSARLARLLRPKDGWTLRSHASERQHMQTGLDLRRTYSGSKRGSKFSHLPEARIWPAGRFVRRTWIRRDPSVAPRIETTELNRSDRFPKDNVLSAKAEAEAAKREREELEKAIKRAEHAARAEAELEQELKMRRSKTPRDTSPPLDTAPDPVNDDVERQLIGFYGRRIRRVAQTAWRSRMEDHIEELRTSVDQTEKVGHHARDILDATRRALKDHINHFRATDVFAMRDGADEEFRNGLGLIRDERDYAAEESKRRGLTGGNAVEDVTQSQAPDVTMAGAVGDEGSDNTDLYADPTPPLRKRGEQDDQTSSLGEGNQGGSTEQPIDAPNNHVQQSIEVEQVTRTSQMEVKTKVGSGTTASTSVRVTTEVEQVHIVRPQDDQTSPLDSLFGDTTLPLEEPREPSPRAKTPTPPRDPTPPLETNPPTPPKQPKPDPAPPTEPVPPSDPTPRKQAPKRPAIVRNRRDPVIDMSTLGRSGRELRSTTRSRSGTPAMNYAEPESSGSDGDEGGKKVKKAAGKKGAKRKVTAKEEMGDEEEYAPGEGVAWSGKRGRGGVVKAGGKGMGRKRAADEDGDGDGEERPVAKKRGRGGGKK